MYNVQIIAEEKIEEKNRSYRLRIYFLEISIKNSLHPRGFVLISRF